jgi:hypothetical protein
MTTQTLTVDQALLDRTGRTADRAVRAVLDTQSALFEEDPILARQFADQANEAAQSAYLLLRQMGADVKTGPAPAPVPLHLLSTAASRRLLDALEFAVQCAQEVDAERGWTLADGTGCGLTDTVGDVYERLWQQVEGPRGRE